MIPRRIYDHAKNHNWFAVAIDFAIVVAGVLVAMQIDNWNDARKAAELERQYLVRLATDMRSTVQKLSEAATRNVSSQSACKPLIRVLNDPSVPEQSIFDAMSTFVEDCWTTPDFRPVDTAFRDIAETGNLNLIRDTQLRDEIISLYDGYADSAKAIAIDQDWLLPIDARLTYEHEVLRWDSRMSALYPEWTVTERRDSIRTGREHYARVAAAYYDAKDSANNEILRARDATKAMLEKIETAMQGR
jgi:hypothetical protein